MYTKHKECTQFIRWECVKSSLFKCPPILKSTLNKKVLSAHHDHSYASYQSALEAVKSKIKIKKVVKISGFTPSQIFNKVINSVPKQILTKMPTEESIK